MFLIVQVIKTGADKKTTVKNVIEVMVVPHFSYHCLKCLPFTKGAKKKHHYFPLNEEFSKNISSSEPAQHL